MKSDKHSVKNHVESLMSSADSLLRLEAMSFDESSSWLEANLYDLNHEAINWYLKLDWTHHKYVLLSEMSDASFEIRDELLETVATLATSNNISLSRIAVLALLAGGSDSRRKLTEIEHKLHPSTLRLLNSVR